MRSKRRGLVFDDLDVADSKYSRVHAAVLYDLKPAFNQERANNVNWTHRVVLSWRIFFGDNPHFPDDSRISA